MQTVKRRFEHIRDFESLLNESGTAVIKFHLRISKDEQAERQRDRLTDPAKHWKFDPQDLEERKLWDDFQQAFEEAIAATTTDDAPWYVVPANHKWFRDAIVAGSSSSDCASSTRSIRHRSRTLNVIRSSDRAVV